MTEPDELERLTLKDLRRLAGEHQLKNRSRLAKHDLLAALRDILAQRVETAENQPDATPRPTEATATSQPVAAVEEPEVLDPAAIAPLTNAAIDATRESGGESAETETESEASGANGQAGDDEEEEAPRRRRRRRRRGRKRRDDEDGVDQADGDGDGDGPADKTTNAPDEVGDEPAPAKSVESLPAAAAPTTQVQAPDEAEPEPKAEPEPADEAPEPRRHREQRPQRTPPPRLDGPQRPLPAVLERLRTLTAGVLELCDPDTPGWAQARLGELLAQVGVVPIPCNGLPHPDFHDVVGTCAGPAKGEICRIEAPGFALRGDRGDLFALRPARVLVAGRPDDSRDDDEGPDDEGPDDEGPSDEGEAIEAPAPSSRVDEPDLDAAPPESQASVAEESGKTDAREEVAEEPDRSASEAGKAGLPTPPPVAGRDTTPVLAESGSPTAGDEESGEDDTARRSRGRRPRRRESATTAATLPLEPQEAEELAARDKSEGFRTLGLNEQVLADLADIGFIEPSPIQAAAIPKALTGVDLIGQALTGTGKTAAFVLPILDRLYQLEGRGPVALVLCPTRELARQVHGEAVRMAGRSAARAALIYGGVSMDDQIEALGRDPHLVIGTPGRIIDHMRRRTLDTSRVAIAVLDEADQMLDIGFLPDIQYILKHTPPTRQTLLFSATMPEPIKELASEHMREPEHIHAEPEAVTVSQVDQKYIAVDHDKKTTLLAHFLETRNPDSMVVFCKTKHQTDRVARVLKNKKLSAGAIHGDLPQAKREKTLKEFRDGTLQCLIATNVAARGLDIPAVSHVVNYDIPEAPEEYVHRIGRTGRMGRPGVARTFITPEDGQFLVEIEKHVGLLLEEEVVDGITASTATEVKRTIAATPTSAGPRLLKPLQGGIRLGRRRR